MSPSAVDFNNQFVLAWSERQLQNWVLNMATAMGWMVYHTHDSRRSEPGYPDLHLVHQGKKLSLFRELKTTMGRTTPAQNKWLDALVQVGVDASVWRPADVVSGRIEKELRGLTND